MRKNIFMIIALLCTVAQGAWAQYSGGTGSATDPYLINSEADWNTLCNNVNDGTSTFCLNELIKSG